MFIDQEYKKEERKIKTDIEKFQGETNESSSSNKPFLFFGLAFVLIVLFAVIFYFFVFRKSPQPPPPPPPENGGATTSTGQLPPDLGGGGEGGGNATSTVYMSPEKVNFGYFYEEPKIDFESTLKSYDLPINIKVDVSNYYDISRKLDLDPYIEYINRDGFAVSDNQFSKKANDFFGIYRNLLEQKTPVVITSDFLFYYYQNILKQAYKDVQKNVFYENVWDMNNQLFNISSLRYNSVLSRVGKTNDPILEGSRLEAAYYAVAMELLRPTENQVNKKENLTDEKKFSEQEEIYFTFDLPTYLEQDVKKEVKLIREGRAVQKSPVLLYERDYSFFEVPDEYKNNAKLNNFYLAIKWMNSVFPLYYLSEECPDCLLDKEDWTINLITASLISHDLYSDEDLKNSWAIIYKFVSFFSGLRQDLTYIHYQYVLKDLFGEDYKIEDIFSLENENRDEDIAKIQEKISEYNFSLLEGSLPRDNQQTKPFIGMRMLQENYWPNDYIMNSLTGKDIKLLSDKNVFTSCSEKGVGMYRCRGFGLDLLNLLDVLDLIESPEINYDYFNENINYDIYDKKINDLKKEFEKFDVYTWNNNIYWVTLDTAISLIDYKDINLPSFYYNDQWRRYKDHNSFLGAWVNLHLSGEKIVNYYSNEEVSYLGGLSECNFNNYIEPNIYLYEELRAKNEMLLKMLSVLKVTEKTTAVANQLKELSSKLNTISDIAKKELSNEAISEEDCQFINSLIKNFTPETKMNKTFTINFESRKLTESIEGAKLLILVYEKEGKKIMAIGPIYNYSEK